VAVALLMSLLAVWPIQAAEEPNFLPSLNPPNDNFVNAADLVLNQRAKTTGLLGFSGLEPLETSDPDLTACMMYHTVWYKFTSPMSGTIALSTAGSIVYDEPYELDVFTRMAVYTGPTLASLTQVECAPVDSGGIANIDLLAISPGVTYYVRVGSAYSGVYSGTYKVRAVIIDAIDFDPVGLGNKDFESVITPLNWVVKNDLNGDDRVCGVGIAYGGTCAFKFVGSVDEATKIQQSATWPINVMVGHEAHRLELIGYVKATTGADLIAKLVIKYSDGTPNSKGKIAITGTFAGYTFTRTGATFDSPNVASVKVMFKNKAASGSTYLDYIILDYDGGLLRSVPDGVLPVPPAAR
jgi:hypothetical protein